MRQRRRHFARYDHRIRRSPRKHDRTHHVGALDAGRGQRRNRHRRGRNPDHGRFGLRLCQGHHRSRHHRPAGRAQVLPRDRKDGLHDPRKGRGDHPLPRRRILRLAARGLQLEGDRQPVRHLQPRRQLRRQNRPVPHVRLPARAGAADEDEPHQGRRSGQRHRRGREPRSGRAAGAPQEDLQQARHRDQRRLPEQPRTALQQRTGAPQTARPAGRLRAAGRTHQGPRLGNPPRPLRQHGVHEAAQAHHPQGRREAPLPVRLPQAAPLRHQRHPPPAAPPSAVPAGGPHFPPRRHLRGRHQERHDERAVLRGTLPRRTRHAGRADRRSHGAVQRHSGAGRRARSRKLLDLLHEDRRGQIQAQSRSGRHASVRNPPAGTHPPRRSRRGGQSLRGRNARMRGRPDGAGRKK